MRLIQQRFLTFLLFLTLYAVLFASKRDIVIKAEELLNRGYPDSALAVLRPLLEEKKPSTEGGKAYFLAIHCFYRLGLPDSVLTLSDVFLSKYRKSSLRNEVLYLRGKVLAEKGRKDEALTSLLEALNTKRRALRDSIKTVILTLFEGEKRGMVARLLETGELKKRLEKSKRVDILLPMTSFPSLSEEFLRGFRLANPGGIEEKIWDVELSSDKVIRTLRKIVNLGTPLVIVALPSKQSEEVAPFLNLAMIPSLFPISYDVSLSRFDGFIYPFTLGLYCEVDAILEFAKRRGLNKLALFHADTPYGNSLKKVFLNKADSHGCEIVLIRSFPPDTMIFEGLKPLLDQVGAEAIIIPGETGSDILLSAYLRHEEIELPILGLEWWGTREASRWGSRFVENVYFAAVSGGVKGDIKRDAERRKLRSKFQALYGGAPSPFAEKGYDCGRIVYEVFKNGPLSSFQVKDVLDEMGIFPGASNYILLSPAPGFINFYTFKNGRMVRVKED